MIERLALVEDVFAISDEIVWVVAGTTHVIGSPAATTSSGASAWTRAHEWMVRGFVRPTMKNRLERRSGWTGKRGVTFVQDE